MSQLIENVRVSITVDFVHDSESHYNV